MKKILGILVVVLVWCNFALVPNKVFVAPAGATTGLFGHDSLKTLYKNNKRIAEFDAEVELNKMLSNSSLPKCEGNDGWSWNEAKEEYVEWNNCIGKADPRHTNTELSDWGITELAVYVGEFVNGKFEGKGMILFGETIGLRKLYIGEFKNDVPHGIGVMTTGFTTPSPGTRQFAIRRNKGINDSAIKGIWDEGYLYKYWKDEQWIDAY